MGKYKVLRHVTSKKALASILHEGVSPKYATTLTKVVWLHEPGLTKEKTRIAAKRHGCQPEDMVVLRIQVHADRLEYCGGGLWCSHQVILPTQILSIRPIFDSNR